MSLLMDALKRAETSKQEAARSQSGNPAAAAGNLLSLEPLADEPVKGAPSALPDLASHLDAVDAELARSAQPAIRPTAAPNKPPAAKQIEPRDTVRNAFAAKLTSQPPSRLPLWAAMGTLGAAAIAIGSYVWYQMNTINQGALVATPSIAPPAARPNVTQIVPAVPLAPSTVFAPAGQSTVAVAAPAAEAPRFAPRPEAPPYREKGSDNEITARAPIRLTRTHPQPDANLVRAHAALQSGETELARRDYEQALQRDPNNTDALLALAAIAQRQARPAEAEGWRQRALVANPGDPAVQAAALSGAAADADPQTTESRLKTLLSSQPESAPLNFALGNLYSRQSRWAEAQQVYFNAVAADGDNPDYLFNLAVSLDHLHQPRLAAQHYRLALDAASKRPAAFERNQVAKRLGELAPEPR